MPTVLIVEDNESILSSLAKLFEGGGFQVKEALGGPEAMKILNGIDVLDIDLIVSDAEMVNGAGLEFLRVVRLRGLEIPFFFLTARNGMDQQKATRMGATGLLDKSPDTDIISAIRTTLKI